MSHHLPIRLQSTHGGGVHVIRLQLREGQLPAPAVTKPHPLSSPCLHSNHSCRHANPFSCLTPSSPSPTLSTPAKLLHLHDEFRKYTNKTDLNKYGCILSYINNFASRKRLSCILRCRYPVVFLCAVTRAFRQVLEERPLWAKEGYHLSFNTFKGSRMRIKLKTHGWRKTHGLCFTTSTKHTLHSPH